jgi:WD40 repeat protein
VPVDTRAHKRLPSFDPGLGAASLSADGKWALDTGAGTKLRSVSTGRDVHWLSTDRLDEDGVFSLDDRLVATIGEGDIEGGDASDEVRLWDVKTGKHVHSFHTGGSPWATTVAVSPDDTLLAAGDVDGFVSIWATDGRFARVARVRAQDATVTALAFDPGSDVLATGGDDGIARLWDARTGNELVQLSGHTGVVHSIAFSPDGSLVVTAGSDRTVRVWDVATGTRLLVLHTPAAVAHAALAGTSAWIVAQLANGRIARFACDACGSTADLLARAAQRTTRSLTPGERRRYLHQS